MMKIYFITVVLLATFTQIHGSNSPILNPVEAWFSTILENIRHFLRGGLSTLPQIDPLHVGSFHLSSGMLEGLQNMINLTGDVENIMLEGLSNYNVTKVEFNLFPPHFETRATLARVRISGNHFLDGQIASWIPFHGRGPFSAAAHDISLGVKADLVLHSGLKIFVNDLKISLNVTRFEFKMLSGGGWTDEIANNLIATSVKTIYDATVPSKLKDLSKLLKNYVNKLLTN